MPPSLSCPACLSVETSLSETLDTAGIAERWACLPFHGSATPGQIRRFVHEDLGSDAIQIFQCSRCGLEFASPSRTWTSSHYPHEKHQLGWIMKRLSPNYRPCRNSGCST